MKSLRQFSAVIASAALLATGVTLSTSAPAGAVPDQRPVDIGAAWLTGQLTDGLLTGDGGANLYGASIDAALSLDAVGGHGATVDAIGEAISTHFKDYTEFAYDYDSDVPADGVEEHYEGQAAGGTAKALLLGQSMSTPRTTMAGVDVLARLESFVATSAPIEGRLVGSMTKDGNADPADEFNNTIGQAFGAAALYNAGSDKTGAVVDFLLEQQCPSGGFRGDFAYDKTASEQGCTASDTPDPDVTSEVIRLLEPQAASSQSVEDALADAQDWLAARQAADGSFGGGVSTGTANSNSTALAGAALGARGDTARATKAAVWVRQHQVDEPVGCSTQLAEETGAIAYDDAALAAGRKDGIGVTAQQWRVAAAQSLPVLAFAPAAASAGPVLAGPTGFVRGGSTVSFSVSGVAPGAPVCLTALGTGRPFAAGLTGTATAPVTFPAVTADRTVTVRDRSGAADSVGVRVLAAKTFSVRTAKTVRRGAMLTVTVSGVRPGEHVKVLLRGVVRRTGIGTAKGTFVARFVATRPLGRAAVTAQGEFPALRRGATTVTVLR